MSLQLLRKTDPLVKTLEAAKKNYILADLIVKETYKEISKINEPFNNQFEAECKGLDRESVLTELCDKMDATEKQFKLPAKQALRDMAEKALLETGAEIIKRISPNKWEEVKIIFDTTTKDPAILSARHKVIDLTLSLDPTR